MGTILIEHAEDSRFEVVIWLHVNLNTAHDYDFALLNELLVVDNLQDVVADVFEHNVRDLCGLVRGCTNAVLVIVDQSLDVVHLAVTCHNIYSGRRGEVLDGTVCPKGSSTSSRELALAFSVIVAADMLLAEFSIGFGCDCTVGCK